MSQYVAPPLESAPHHDPVPEMSKSLREVSAQLGTPESVHAWNSMTGHGVSDQAAMAPFKSANGDDFTIHDNSANAQAPADQLTVSQTDQWVARKVPSVLGNDQYQKVGSWSTEEETSYRPDPSVGYQNFDVEDTNITNTYKRH